MIKIKTYKFSMEKILEWRTNIERNTMEEFASLQNELQHEKAVLAGLEKQYGKTRDEKLKSYNVNELMQKQLYIQIMEEKIEEQNQLIYIKKDEVEDARVELVAAQKDRKIMEKLKEKDHNDYQENIKSLEQKELDEMAVLRFNRVVY